jgi:transcriptional regulator with XRE-family HTH domain
MKQTNVTVTEDEVRELEQTVAANIKKCREASKLTQEELARRIGVSVYTVQGWEQASFFPKPESLIVIAKAFDIKRPNVISRTGVWRIRTSRTVTCSPCTTRPGSLLLGLFVWWFLLSLFFHLNDLRQRRYRQQSFLGAAIRTVRKLDI